jgi:hypothetical protein
VEALIEQSGVFNIILRGSFSIGLLTRVQQRRVSVHGIAIAIAIVAGLCTKNKNNHPTSALHATCCMLLNGPLSLSLYLCWPCLFPLCLHVWSIPWGSVPFRCIRFRPIVRGSRISARYAQGARPTCLRIYRVLGVYACVYIWGTQACRLLRYICRASKTFLP